MTFDEFFYDPNEAYSFIGTTKAMAEIVWASQQKRIQELEEKLRKKQKRVDNFSKHLEAKWVIIQDQKNKLDEIRGLDTYDLEDTRLWPNHSYMGPSMDLVKVECDYTKGDWTKREEIESILGDKPNEDL